MPSRPGFSIHVFGAGPFLSPRLALAVLVTAIAWYGVVPATAQTFARVVDAANPIVADAGVPANSFTGCAWMDYNQDGLPDLFVNQRFLYRNNGAGAFTRVTLPATGPSLGSSWADFDNDGDMDVFVTGPATGGPGERGSFLIRNDGSDVFQKVLIGASADTAGNSGWACAWGDYDDDGFVDVVVTLPAPFLGSHPNRLMRNRRDGTLEQDVTTDVTTGVGPYTVPTWSDWDQDGDPDLSIGAGPADGSTGPDYLYRNLTVGGGSPRLSRITTGAVAATPRDGQVLNWIDYDNDGDFDVFITNVGGGFLPGMLNQMYRNDGGTFVQMTSGQVGDIVTEVDHWLASVWGDYDNDGDQDCLVTKDGSAAPLRYYRNNGNGTFTRIAAGDLTAANVNSFSAAAADYDRDGDLDLFTTGPAGGKGLFRNDLAAGSRWILIRCAGVSSNRSAIGTIVRAVATVGGVSVSQLREVSAQNSFNGHSHHELHFGFGTATVIDTLVVRWPSGIIETHLNVPTNQFLSLTEDISTPAVVSPVWLKVYADSVDLAWFVAGDEVSGFAVERRDDVEDWAVRSPVARDGEGWLRFVDRAVVAGAHYGYRLTFRDGPDVRSTPEVRVTIPVPALALAVHGWALDSRSLRLSIELPATGEASIAVFDVAGRQVAAQTVSAGAGAFECNLPLARPLPQGLVFVRLRQGTNEISTKTVFVR